MTVIIYHVFGAMKSLGKPQWLVVLLPCSLVLIVWCNEKLLEKLLKTYSYGT